MGVRRCRAARLPALAAVAAAALAGCGSATASIPTGGVTTPTCPALPQRIVADVNHLRSDERLSPAGAGTPISCRRAIVDDRHPAGRLPVIGAGLMTLTSVRYPHGRLVWVVATSPGAFVPAGPAPTPGHTTSAAERYAFSVDIIDARTGRWLEAIEGS